MLDPIYYPPVTACGGLSLSSRRHSRRVIGLHVHVRLDLPVPVGRERITIVKSNVLSEVVIVALVSRPTADVVSNSSAGLVYKSRPVSACYMSIVAYSSQKEAKIKGGVSGDINSPSRWNDRSEPKQNAAVDAVSQHMCREESRNGYFLFQCMQFREVNQM
jgi:hypothetical protein